MHVLLVYITIFIVGSNICVISCKPLFIKASFGLKDFHRKNIRIRTLKKKFL
jgi:hypothetical protein